MSGIFLSSFCYAQEFRDPSTQEASHRAIRAVYEAILEAKPHYPELSAFDERAVSTNPEGLPQIFYQYPDPRLPLQSLPGGPALYRSGTGQARLPQKNQPYELLITVGPLHEGPQPRPEFEAKHYGFPILGMRVSCFIKGYRRSYHYDVHQALRKGLDLLYAHQQQYFPFELILRPLKESFKVGERIAFEVTVKNKTNQNLKIKNLGEKTLFFTINGQEWGTKSSAAGRPGQEEYILGPHDSVSRSFRGNSFKKPGEVEIFCTYNLAYKGILPFGTLKITIEE